MRFCNWVLATGIRHFVKRDYYYPLTFDISSLLCGIPTSIYALKKLRPGTDVSPSPWLRHCLQDRIISLLQVMHKAKYPEVEESYKNCHTDIYFKTKTVVAHAAKC